MTFPLRSFTNCISGRTACCSVQRVTLELSGDADWRGLRSTVSLSCQQALLPLSRHQRPLGAGRRARQPHRTSSEAPRRIPLGRAAGAGAVVEERGAAGCLRAAPLDGLPSGAVFNGSYPGPAGPDAGCSAGTRAYMVWEPAVERPVTRRPPQHGLIDDRQFSTTRRRWPSPVHSGRLISLSHPSVGAYKCRRLIGRLSGLALHTARRCGHCDAGRRARCTECGLFSSEQRRPCLPTPRRDGPVRRRLGVVTSPS